MGRSMLFAFLFILPFHIAAQDTVKTERSLFERIEDPPSAPRVELGFEWGSLYQNGFRDIGPDNFSYMLALHGGEEWMQGYGLRLMGVHVALTPERARNHQGIDLGEGSFEGVEGSIRADRLYLDLYPLRFGILERKDDKGFALEWAVGVSPGIGYNSWELQRENSSTRYLLDGLSLGLALRTRLELYDRFFIEYPFFDLFAFLHRGPRSQKLGPGKARIESEAIGLFSWGTLGFRFPLPFGEEDQSISPGPSP